MLLVTGPGLLRSVQWSSSDCRKRHFGWLQSTRSSLQLYSFPCHSEVVSLFTLQFKLSYSKENNNVVDSLTLISQLSNNLVTSWHFLYRTMIDVIIRGMCFQGRPQSQLRLEEGLQRCNLTHRRSHDGSKRVGSRAVPERIFLVESYSAIRCDDLFYFIFIIFIHKRSANQKTHQHKSFSVDIPC